MIRHVESFRYRRGSALHPCKQVYGTGNGLQLLSKESGATGRCKRQFAPPLPCVHRSTILLGEGRTICISSCIDLTVSFAYCDALSLSLFDFICKLVKIRVADYRSCGRIQRRIRYVTKFKHRDKHRCFDARNINCTMRHTSWPLRSLCHALSSLSSQLIPIGSLQRKNRLATIDGYLISLSLLPPPSSPLDLCLVVAGTLLLLSVFCNSAQKGREGGKKKLLISKDIKYPPPRWISRDLQQRAPSRILFCLRSFRSKTRRLSKQNNVSMGQERESLP